jgi:predicted nucleic acid-binding protein
VRPALIDSNVFIYAFDPADPVKHERAIELIEEVTRDGDLVLSAQVLNEVAWTLLRRGAKLGLGPREVRQIVEEIAQSALVVPVTPELTFTTLTVALAHGLSFWDGLIWAAARQHRVAIIYTEDFQNDREVEGVRFVDPFRVASHPGEHGRP